MIKLAAALILVISIASCSSEWTAPDKVKHAKMGVMIGGGTAVALNFAGYNGNRPLAATLVVIAAAGLKEGYDEYSYGGADWRDALATIIPGTLAANGFHWAANWKVEPLNDGFMLNYERSFER